MKLFKTRKTEQDHSYEDWLRDLATDSLGELEYEKSYLEAISICSTEREAALIRRKHADVCSIIRLRKKAEGEADFQFRKECMGLALKRKHMVINLVTEAQAIYEWLSASKPQSKHDEKKA